MSTIFDCADSDSRAAGIRAAVGSIKAGRLVVMPTDTVYGIACDAFDSDAVGALLSAKNRSRDMPVQVLVGSWDTIDGLVMSVSSRMRDLVQAFWPGGVSLLVEQAPSLAWDLGDTRGTVMVRMPLHPVAIEVLREVGPMGASSANKSGLPPAASAQQAREQLGDDVAVYLEGGVATNSTPSTIVDLTADAPKILRVGAVAPDDIAQVLGVDAATLVD